MAIARLDPAAEFDRQVRNLLDRGYPALAGLDPDTFAELVAPLRPTVAARGPLDPPGAGRVPFVLVITRELAPTDLAVALTTLPGKRKPGIIDRNYAPGELTRFVPTAETRVPPARAYLIFDVERGEEFVGIAPEPATAMIARRGRTPLTIDEGIALVTQFPAVLEKNKCFSLAGSRCGDRRVPALWISDGAPKLGWCWAGNPHSWLGCASCGDRVPAA